MTGGGGAGLNFSVKAYSALPEAGKENEIAVITETPMTGWVFSNFEPSEPAEGMVWVRTGAASGVAFNALKKNGLMVYPIRAIQYISGAWVDKTANSYIGGEWVPWVLYLFYEGHANEPVTGGFYGTIQDGGLYYTATLAKGTGRSFTTKKPIELSGFTTLKAKMKSNVTSSDVYFRLIVDDTEKDASNADDDTFTKYTSLRGGFSGEETEVVLDVSELSGPFYVGYQWYINSSASGNRVPNGYVMEMSME